MGGNISSQTAPAPLQEEFVDRTKSQQNMQDTAEEVFSVREPRIVEEDKVIRDDQEAKGQLFYQERNPISENRRHKHGPRRHIDGAPSGRSGRGIPQPSYEDERRLRSCYKQAHQKMALPLAAGGVVVSFLLQSGRRAKGKRTSILLLLLAASGGFASGVVASVPRCLKQVAESSSESDYADYVRKTLNYKN